MSIRTTAASAVMTILVTGATLTLAGFYFPLQLTAQEAADLQVRWKRPSLHASGLVQVEATLSADGQVIDARVLSGPDELRKEALQAVLFSRFAKGLAPRVITVSIEFSKGTSTAVPPPPPPPPPPVSEAEFEGTDYVGLSPEIQQRAMEVMAGLRSGQHLTSIEIGDFNAKLMQLDASLRLTSRMSSTGAGPVMLRLIVMKQNAVAQSPAVIRVGPNVQEANLINRVDPEYPPLAKQARIQGVVRFAILVGKDGGVERVTVQNGHPLLIPSAMEAVRQYKFRPTLLNGQPITVATTVEVNFVL